MFDAVVLDVMMPGMSGIEVARRLRSDRSQVPIVMLTARDSPADIMKGLDAGATTIVAAASPPLLLLANPLFSQVAVIA